MTRYTVNMTCGCDPQVTCDQICQHGDLVATFCCERVVEVEASALSAIEIENLPGVHSVVRSDAVVEASSPPLQWAQEYLIDWQEPVEFAPTLTGKGAHIYNVDTLARQTPDLAGRLTVIFDPIGDVGSQHGSETMGCAAGTVYGIARDALCYNSVGFNGSGSGSVSSVTAALDAVLDHVIANGHGGSAILFNSYEFRAGIGGDPFHALMQSLIAAGVFVVVASGNGNPANGNAAYNLANFNVWPAKTPNVLTVAGHDFNGIHSWFANYGEPWVDLHAPAQLVAIMKENGTLQLGNGTSYSCPLVAGIAALGIEAGAPDLWAWVMDAAAPGAVSGVPTGPDLAAQLPAAALAPGLISTLILSPTSGGTLIMENAA